MRAIGRPVSAASATAVVAVLLAVGLVAALLVAGHRGEQPTTGRLPDHSVGEPRARVFADRSWWNTPLPWQVPVDPYQDQILNYLRTAPESGKGCLVLAGAGHNPWGQPIYRAGPRDRSYRVTVTNGTELPELHHLRIPAGAESAANNDGSMTIYDVRRGYVVMLTDARYDPSGRGHWSASGATVTYLHSNGYDVRTGRSDDPRNRGSHRGNNGATAAVAYSEVQDGALHHVVKVAIGPEAAHRAIFPMVGSDGDYRGSDPAVPPEGLRLRLNPNLDLSGLDPQAQVIAHGLQRYGFYIGDSGGTTALKLENTVAEGRGQLWKLSSDALCGMPFTPQYWTVVAENYDPTLPGSTP